MSKLLYKYMAAFLLLGIIASCSSDPLVDTPLSESDVPVELNAMLTRALGDAGDLGDGQIITTGNPLQAYFDAVPKINFYLTARTTAPTPANYF